MQNDDKQRPGQPAIHSHLPDSVPPEDVKKIVGDAVPRGADYNSPPPAGARKSMGSGIDDSVGGPGLGLDPESHGHGTTVRAQDSRADDRHMGNLQQGGGNAQRSTGSGGVGSAGNSGHAAPDVSLDKASGQSRQVATEQEANKAAHGDQLAHAVERVLGTKNHKT